MNAPYKERKKFYEHILFPLNYVKERTGLSRKEQQKALEILDKLRDRMVDLTAKYEKNHLKRVRNSKCSGVSGVFFLEMLTEFRKISRHFGNVTDRAQKLCK